MLHLYNSGGSSTSLFDVTMGSYDGAETRELVGAFLLLYITFKHGNDFGLYRDDRLNVMNASPRAIENVENTCAPSSTNSGLKLLLKFSQNFLDITPYLSTSKYQPYSKPNNIPLYVHNKSSHPPKILQNNPLSSNKRLSQISSDNDNLV